MERIALASDKAAQRLVEMMQDPKVPYAVQLSAAKDLLDRANITGTTTVEIELPWQQLLTGIVASVDEDVSDVRRFFQPGELDRSSPTVLTPGVDYAVSDEDYSPAGTSASPAEAVDYGQAPRHDPAYPPEPRAGQPSDRPRQRRSRRR